MNTWREVRLPADLCQAAEERIKGTGFASLEALLAFVLRELTSSSGARLEDHERKVIEQRLRDLGYL